MLCTMSVSKVCCSVIGLLLLCCTASARNELTRAVYDSNTIIHKNALAANLCATLPDSAIKMYEQNLEASNDILFAGGAIQCLQQLGRLCTSIGAYDRCMEIYKRQEMISRQSSIMLKVLPIVYNGMGNLYKLQGYYDQAAKSYYTSIDLSTKLNLPPSSSVFNNLASVLAFMGKYQQSLGFLARSEELARSTKNNGLLASVLTNRGLVFKDMHQWDSCLYYFQAALRIADKDSLDETIYTTRTNLGQAYLAQKQPAKALKYLLEARKTPIAVNPYYEVTASETIALAYQMMGDNGEALHYFHDGLQKAERYHLNENAMSISGNLAKLYEEAGNHKMAYELLEKSMALKDSIRGNDITRAISQMEVKYRTAEQEKELLNKQLTIAKQKSFLKRKNMWIAITSGGALLLLALVVFMFGNFRNRRRLQEKHIRILEQERKLLLHGQEIVQLKAMIKGEEKERGRLAQELHDGIGGMLTAITLNVKALQRRNAHLTEFSELDEILLMLRETALEVRGTAHNLMPDILLDYSIPEALQMYCDHLNREDLQVNLHFHGPVEHMDKFTTLTIYRVIQELLQNIVKHANATIAEIQLRSDQSKVILTVEDNGKGFDRNTTSDGLGLKTMKTRIEAMGGYISVESTPGMGTTVHIELCLQKEEESAIHEYPYSHS